MLVAPTIIGNVISGPTAEDLPAGQVHATNTTLAGIAAIKSNAQELCPDLAKMPVVAQVRDTLTIL